MNFKIAFLLLAVVVAVSVYADEEQKQRGLFRRDWTVDDVKRKIDEYLEKASRDHVLARLEAGIAYLKGLGGPIRDVPRAVEQVFRKFNEEQKQQLLTYLEELKQD